MKKTSSEHRTQSALGLRQQVLLAALECSGGDLNKSFTAEDLLLAAWKKEPTAWGLRGHETEHPDSEKIYKELDRVTVAGRNLKGGMVALGLFEKVRQRTFRLTTSGLALASKLNGADPGAKGLAERALADAISAILSHSVFLQWLRDPSSPKHFRDAGHFWGIAPGTPPSVIRARILSVENTLKEAKELLDKKDVDEIGARHGKTLFERNDLFRAEEFQQTIKQRFAKDLATLGAILE